MKINWNQPVLPRRPSFSDIPVNSCFKLASGEAIYRKIEAGRGTRITNKSHSEVTFAMLEEATGKLFVPTSVFAEVVPVEVEINIRASKPSIY